MGSVRANPFRIYPATEYPKTGYGLCSRPKWLRSMDVLRTWLLEHEEFTVPDLRSPRNTISSVPETRVAA